MYIAIRAHTCISLLCYFMCPCISKCKIIIYKKNSMLFAVSRDAVLAGLFGARHTEYTRARLVHVHVQYAYACTARATTRRCASFVVNTPRKSWQTNHDAKLTRPFLLVGRGWLARLGLGGHTLHCAFYCSRTAFWTVLTLLTDNKDYLGESFLNFR